jgi:hypothetical protein
VPADNVYKNFDIDVPAQTVSPVFSDGYWLMLNPLSAGEHDVKFGGTLALDPNFTLDVTYHLTVQSSPTAIPLPAGFAPGFAMLTALTLGEYVRRARRMIA